MRRDALRLDFEADESLVRDRELELRRLDDDCRVGMHAVEHGDGADRRELLVRDRSDDHVAAKVLDLRCRVEDRRERALHVVGAAPVQPAGLDARLERRLHPGDADRVEVRVQQQRASAAAAAGDGDHARALGRTDELDVEARVRAPLGYELRDLALAGSAVD